MSGFAHPEYLATTEWLAAHLDDPNVIVLDCTMHLTPDPKVSYQMKPGLEDFEQGHIRGAQFVNMLRDVSDTSQSLPFMRQTPEDFAAAMRRFGVNNTTRVVTYSTSLVWWGDTGMVAATRVRPRQCGSAGWRLAEVAARGPSGRGWSSVGASCWQLHGVRGA
jgi:3-mercaptopyruvate sulfurtransferase SseA